MGTWSPLPLRTVFVHGRGRSGAPAWPLLAEEGLADDVFLERTCPSDQPERDADRVVDALEGPGHVVAHSYGTVTALLAAQRRPDRLRSLVLVEPSCNDLTRGGRQVERYVRAMAPVFAVAEDPEVDGEDFLARFAAGMGTALPDLDARTCEELATRIRATPPPWEIPLRSDTPRLVPTLVITGETGPLYAEVAASLEAKGARHLVVPGAGHRPQDTPEGRSAIRAFAAEHS